VKATETKGNLYLVKPLDKQQGIRLRHLQPKEESQSLLTLDPRVPRPIKEDRSIRRQGREAEVIIRKAALRLGEEAEEK